MTTAPLLPLSILIGLAIGPVQSGAGLEPGSVPGPAILQFHADWCAPCQEMEPAIQALREGRYPVKQIDVEEHPELAETFGVSKVPTLIIVDEDGQPVDRMTGIVSAQELASRYNRSLSDSGTPRSVSQSARPQNARNVRLVSADPTPVLPKPWATVVRITVRDRMLGFGSGTVIDSTPERSIILTCAHIFKVSRGRQPSPDQFRLPVQVELFDGNLTGPTSQTVRPLGDPMPGRVIDYDFERDVALVEIKPGRVIASSRVVPKHWSPESQMRMYTVGCSRGRDATAWNTKIEKPIIRPFGSQRPNYFAILCQYSPIRGRSGGGLYTDNGYVAGVCNFAFDPGVSKGLYAAPPSIYEILDRNGLSSLYEWRNESSGTYLASRETPRNNNPRTIVRGQSPREDRNPDAVPILREEISLPPPDRSGFPIPESIAARRQTPDPRVPREVAPVSGTAGRGQRQTRSAWKPTMPTESSRSSLRRQKSTGG